LFVFATLCVFFQSTPDARAWKFGAEERIHDIQDVKMRGPRGEALHLGYKTTVQHFMLGMYIQDGGYVLGIRDDSQRYYNQPSDKEVERLLSVLADARADDRRIDVVQRHQARTRAS
jgi:hypothetical protein